MRNFLVCLIMLALLPSATPLPPEPSSPINVSPSGNLIIITIDGFRWQELFTGADVDLLNDPGYVQDSSIMKAMYGAETTEQRRQQLMPFFWSILSRKGQLLGNRRYRNQVNTANMYAFSYPGYNEIFTGTTDLRVSSNKKKPNNNINVLEFLAAQPGFTNKVVSFTSWDVFPYILNEERSGMLVNSGYEALKDGLANASQHLVARVQAESFYEKSGTRNDQLTFLTAMEYLKQHRPKVVFLGLGETDEYAHQERYDLYLEQANKIDRMIAQLWHWVQTTPGYRDNTSLLITTDHGRGGRDARWSSHSSFISGSSETWLAMMGPGIQALGERKEEAQHYQQEIAGLIAGLVGQQFEVGKELAGK